MELKLKSSEALAVPHLTNSGLKVTMDKDAAGFPIGFSVVDLEPWQPELVAAFVKEHQRSSTIETLTAAFWATVEKLEPGLKAKLDKQRAEAKALAEKAKAKK